MTCQHTKHICATWNGFCVCFLHRINTLSRICALHNAKICFCNIRWSSSNMNGALKDVSQKHNTDFLSKWTLPFALLHLHVMRVWYFRVTQYFSGMVNAITHWLSLVRFPPIWQNGHRITRWVWRQQFKMAGGWDDMTTRNTICAGYKSSQRHTIERQKWNHNPALHWNW